MESNFQIKHKIEKIYEGINNLKLEVNLWQEICPGRRNKKLFFVFRTPNSHINEVVKAFLNDIADALNDGLYIAIKDYIKEIDDILKPIENVLDNFNRDLKADIDKSYRD